MEILKIIFKIIMSFLDAARHSSPKTEAKKPEPKKESKLEEEVPIYQITRDDVLMGRDKQAPLSEEQENNLKLLITNVNRFLKVYNKKLEITSGYRPPSINAKIGGGANSMHLHCLAVDFRDRDGSLSIFCLDNLDLLYKCDLWIEDPKWTRVKNSEGDIVGGWTHFQAKSPRSGRRVFVPSTSPAIDPDFWSGNYDQKKYDKVS